MIIETEVEGRPAIVAFLDKDFNPVDEDDAEVIRSFQGRRDPLRGPGEVRRHRHR
jgi:hypothetical protein